MELTYAKYLQIDRLLDLQYPRSEPVEHDEMLFIVIHQVYELWFKQMLWELDRVKQLFSDGRIFLPIAAFKRARMILKTLVGQLDVLETMTPMSFNSFRDRLDTASGFQSTQFREFEFVLGHKRPEALSYLRTDSAGHERALRRWNEPTVVDHFYLFLARHGVAVPQSVLDRDVTLMPVPDPDVQRGLLALYRARPEMGLLFEQMMDVDEGLQEWRYRHVKIVERTIGNKRGTGGSLGTDFLKNTLFKPIFPDLWAIRHEF